MIAQTAVVSGATGTNIGDMAAGGGLPAAFDGNTSKAASVCAQASSVTHCYVGKNYSPPKSIFSAILYAPNNTGVTGGDNQTINLRAKQTAPANSADGLLLATTGPQADPGAASTFTLTSSDQGTQWAYVWFEIIDNTAASNLRTAQVIFTEATYVAGNAPSQMQPILAQ